MEKHLLNRIKSPPLGGIILISTSFGLEINPEESEAIIAIGLLLAGLVGTFVADS